MPASIITDWKRVAQSGPTMDGREIKPEWLTDMAETYSPEIYTAKLWIDHKRWNGAYGSVQALKAAKDGDVTRLFARISPNRSLLELNQVFEEKLHFSIEVIENFAKTGKYYLGGLGMTDEPASLGTDELRFAKIPGMEFTARYAGEAVPDFREMDDDRMDRFFHRLAGFFRFKPQQEEENTMDEKTIKEFKDSLAGMHTAVMGISEAVAKLSAAAPAPATSQPAAPADRFEELKTGLTAVTEKFDALMGRLEKAAPGTFAGETHKPADGLADIL